MGFFFSESVGVFDVGYFSEMLSLSVKLQLNGSLSPILRIRCKIMVLVINVEIKVSVYTFLTVVFISMALNPWTHFYFSA